MCGNMKEGGDGGEVSLELVLSESVPAEIGASEVIERRVSAATIPPIECPINIVWTLGSIVGEGVEAETSMSMTTFCSLKIQSKNESRARDRGTAGA